MKFRLLSDIHLEFYQDKKNYIINYFFRLSKEIPVDYLILAGDITNFTQRYSYFFELISKIKPFYKQIFFVLGNHEFYEHFNFNKTKEKFKKLCSKLNIILLDNQEYHLEKNYYIYGTTLWSNITTENYALMNDKLFIDYFDIKKDYSNNIYQLEKLKLQNKDTDKLYIIVSHHLPSFELISPLYKNQTLKNKAYASDCSHIFGNHILYWCHGHTHQEQETTINNINFLCNPFGYPKENISKKTFLFKKDFSFNYDKIFEIKMPNDLEIF